MFFSSRGDQRAVVTSPTGPPVGVHWPLREVHVHLRGRRSRRRRAARDALVTDPAQGGLALELEVAVEVAEALEADLEGVVVDRHVGAPVQDPALDAPDVDGSGGPDVERAARLHDPLPERRSAVPSRR